MRIASFVSMLFILKMGLLFSFHNADADIYTHFLSDQAEYDMWDDHFNDDDLNWENIRTHEGSHNHGGEMWILRKWQNYPDFNNDGEFVQMIQYELWHFKDDGSYVYNLYNNYLPLD